MRRSLDSKSNLSAYEASAPKSRVTLLLSILCRRPMVFYYLGDFTQNPRRCDIQNIKNSNETEDLKTGQVVETWDHVFEWDEHCVRASVLESLVEQPPFSLGM